MPEGLWMAAFINSTGCLLAANRVPYVRPNETDANSAAVVALAQLLARQAAKQLSNVANPSIPKDTDHDDRF
jgi:hypothetical protein